MTDDKEKPGSNTPQEPDNDIDHLDNRVIKSPDRGGGELEKLLEGLTIIKKQRK